MRLLLCCPNGQFIVGSPAAFPIVKAMEELGFEFKVREQQHGAYCYTNSGVYVDVGTVEELIELQRKVGMAFRLEGEVVIIQD
jgi:hypothetical protein